MQARRGGRHTAVVARIDGLIARLIGGVGRVRDVGRQRHLANRFQNFMCVTRALKSQLKKIVDTLKHFRADTARKVKSGARFGRFARAHMGVYREAIGLHTLNQYLDAAARLFMAVQARLDDLGIVKHQQIMRAQQLRQFTKHTIRKRSRTNLKQARARPRRSRVLGDQFGRQQIIKITELHGRVRIQEDAL